MAPPSKCRILLVDDHPFLRDGLSGLLKSQPDFEIVGEAGTAAEGIALLRELRPTLVIVDLRLPDADGSEVLAAALRQRWETYSVVFSAFSSDDDRLMAVRAGARAYLTKTARNEDVLATIRRVVAGEDVLRASLPSALRARLPEKNLTPRETEILRLLGKGLPNKEISKLTRRSENTVKAHLRRIFAKLDVSNRSEAAAIALRRGLVTLLPFYLPPG